MSGASERTRKARPRRAPRAAAPDSEEYAFRYPLDEGRQEPVYHDPLLEMIRRLLESLLNVVTLVRDGQEVKVDGFKLLRDDDTAYRIFPGRGPARPQGATAGGKGRDAGGISFQEPRNAALYEPRIELIKRALESLLTVVELEQGGQPVRVDAFRLRDLRHWLVPSRCDPLEVFGYGGTRCNVDCVFCYLKGNPPDLALVSPRRKAEEELREMATRLRHFSPETGRALFPTWGDVYEVFAHPQIMAVLRALREKTPQVFRISTTGRLLSEGFVRELAELRPLYLYLSLHTTNPQRLRRLMRTPRPEVHLEAPALLQRYRIPYALVIVPWPLDGTEAMLADLDETIAQVDRYSPHVIEVHLPGYSRWFSPRELFDREAVWSAVVARVRALREAVATPIVVMPSMYEENLCEERKNVPGVIGLVRNSPAARAGLRRGDVIEGINALAVRTRPQARDLLALLQGQRQGEATLRVRRDGQELSLRLDLADFDYPYSQEADRHLGIVMLGSGFRTGYIERLREIIDRRRARHVLFLSSLLVKPHFQQALRETGLLDTGAVRLDIEVPANRYFGGNIILGDLLVVQDFIDCIREYLARGNPRPDLVVIPSSPFALGEWKRDLTGRVYLDIEREVGIPVELLKCEPIYD